jgi:long-chain acyl-CoA synthetase
VGAVLEDAAPVVVIAGAEQAPLLPAAGAFVRLEAEQGYPRWRDSAAKEDPSAASYGAATLVLLYTSGTTGRPKGVRISHTNLFCSTRMAREIWGFTAASVNLAAMPMFHIGGLGYSLMALSQGGHTVLLQQPSPLPVLEAIARYRVTHAFFVPTVIQALLDTPGVEGMNLRSLERMVYGAAPISESLLDHALRVFGCGFNHAYGMTETAGTVVTLQPGEHDPGGPNRHRLLSCGRPVPWVELSIRDLRTGLPVTAGEVGEIWIRSPMVTAGYWNNPAETAAVLLADGWLRTGDAALQDEDGFIYIRDRYKDLIVSGGENVFPAEVENVLAEHPDISEAAVVGAPHPRWGETVRAVVVAKQGRTLVAGDVVEFCRSRLAHYKCPTLVEFVPTLPKSASGKILRRELKK